MRGHPTAIVNAHPSDQRTQLRIDLRPASKAARLPTPIPAETGVMPTHEGLRSNDRDGIENRWKPSIQQDEEQAISVGEVNTTTHLPPQYDQLTSERHVLCLKSALRLERRDQQGQEEAEQRNHRAADVRRFSHLINTDEVFGTYSGHNLLTASQNQ